MMQDVKPRLDRDARREAILDVARDVFLEEGYANASMSTIAARVGGSKGTLYNYFKNKEDLFAAYVVRHCAWQRDAMFALSAEAGDIRATLTQVGRSFLSTVLSDFSVANFRVIVAEAERTPALGIAFHETGPRKGAEILGDILQKAVDRGQLKIENPIQAGRQFIGLCQNWMMKARLCNAIPAPTPEEIDREVLPAVEMFLAAYGTKR